MDIDHHPSRLLNRQEMLRLTGLSKSSVYRFMKNGLLPEGAIIARKRYWKLGEVTAALDRLYANNRTTAAQSNLPGVFQ